MMKFEEIKYNDLKLIDAYSGVIFLFNNDIHIKLCNQPDEDFVYCFSFKNLKGCFINNDTIITPIKIDLDKSKIFYTKI